MRHPTLAAVTVVALWSAAGSAHGDEPRAAVTVAQAAPPPAAPQPPPPGYGAPPPGYGPPPPGYGPPPQGYPPPGYGPPPGYPPAYYYPPQGYYPPPQTPPPPPRERFSTGMMVGGIVLAAAGAIGLFAGAAVYAKADRDAELTPRCSDTPGGAGTSCPSPPDYDDEKATGVALMIAGGVGIAVGVPLLIIGARKVPVDKNAPADKQPVVQASLRLSPRAGALRFAF